MLKYEAFDFTGNLMKSIILCADDYGQNASISQAIVELLKLKCLSAVSCMTTSPHWFSQASWLLPYKDYVDIGLHFNLTHGFAIKFLLG